MFTREQFNMLMIKINEVSESNMLVAATNIANDQNISLSAAIRVAMNAMDEIRELKMGRREEAWKDKMAV
jgi:hypothetical protein